MKKLYYKLVRDKIPKIIRAKGVECKCTTCGEDFLENLDRKLQEEVTEYLQNPCVEELADIAEVLSAILVERGISVEELKQVRQKKFDERGGFSKKVFLISTDDGNSEGCS